MYVESRKDLKTKDGYPLHGYNGYDIGDRLPITSIMYPSGWFVLLCYQ